MTVPRRPISAPPSTWQPGQRRMFLLVVVLEVCASMAALWSQAPNFDALDVWALPLLSALMLGAQLLLSMGLIRYERATSLAFLGGCTYLLLALSHQYSVMPPGARTLSENTWRPDRFYESGRKTSCQPTSRAV